MIFLQALKSPLASRVPGCWERPRACLRACGRRGWVGLNWSLKLCDLCPVLHLPLSALFSRGWGAANHEDIVADFSEAASVDEGTRRAPERRTWGYKQYCARHTRSGIEKSTRRSMHFTALARVLMARGGSSGRLSQGAGSASVTWGDWLCIGEGAHFRWTPEVFCRPGHGYSGTVTSEL